MAGKARVHELAKELGVTSKEVLARLSQQGEFVKSASSTVEAPVARRLRESFGGGKATAEKASNVAAKAGSQTWRSGRRERLRHRRARVGDRRRRRPAPPLRGTGGDPAAHAVRPRGQGDPGPGAARCAGARSSVADPAASRSRRGARASRCGSRPDAWPQARRAGAARRQQPVLLGAARRPADPASARAASRRPAARSAAPAVPRPATCRPVRRCRTGPSTSSRCAAARCRRPARCSRRWTSRWGRRR